LGPTNKQVGSPILHPADSDNPKQVGSFNRSAGSERIELKSIKSNQSAHIEAPNYSWDSWTAENLPNNVADKINPLKLPQQVKKGDKERAARDRSTID